jgi:Ca2+-binding EF-hand superfamily protein
MMPSTSNQIIEAFKVLDPKGRGYLYKDELLAFLKDFGESICDDDLSEMLNAAIDPITNKVDYESYTVQLTHEPDDDENIYKIAERIKNEKPEKGRK